MMPRKTKENLEALIEDALTLINTPNLESSDEKMTVKLRRACARAKLETLMERKRLKAEISDNYDYLEEF